jgi:hypothetical protein
VIISLHIELKTGLSFCLIFAAYINFASIHHFREDKMNIFKNYSKYLLSFALAALLGSAVLTGCSGPSDYQVQSVEQPTVAAPQSNISDQADFGQAIAAQNRHTAALLETDGVIGTGIGRNNEGNTAIYIYTTRNNVAHIPSELDGFPTIVKNVGVVEARAVYTQVYRNPFYSGVSIGNDRECAAGTFGCKVVDANGVEYMLSNNHVLARQNSAALGERIDQPGRFEMANCAQTGQVASLSKFVKINIKRTASNVVDGAIARFSGAFGQTSQVADQSYTPTSTPVAATVGMQVQKVGRTTGHTFGTVNAVNVTMLVQYSRGVARFVNQIEITPGTFSAGGDSGSLIVEYGGTAPNPVGLLFAGGTNSTFANPIQSALTALGVTIVAN